MFDLITSSNVCRVPVCSFCRFLCPGDANKQQLSISSYKRLWKCPFPAGTLETSQCCCQPLCFHEWRFILCCFFPCFLELPPCDQMLDCLFLLCAFKTLLGSLTLASDRLAASQPPTFLQSSTVTAIITSASPPPLTMHTWNPPPSS